MKFIAFIWIWKQVCILRCGEFSEKQNHCVRHGKGDTYSELLLETYAVTYLFFSVETCIIICSENLCNLQTSHSCWPVPIAVLLFIIIFVWFQYQLNASISLNFDQFAFRKKHRINGDLLEIVVIQCQSNANIVIQCYASELINCWRQLSLKRCCLWHWIFAVKDRFSRCIIPYSQELIVKSLWLMDRYTEVFIKIKPTLGNSVSILFTRRFNISGMVIQKTVHFKWTISHIMWPEDIFRLLWNSQIIILVGHFMNRASYLNCIINQRLW